ncbi:34280_t:CDS:2, partial [Gigaspora margarita]
KAPTKQKMKHTQKHETSYSQDTKNKLMKTKILKITLTNYKTTPMKEKQNFGLQKRICCKPKSTNNDDTENDNQTKRRAKTPIPVNDYDVMALTKRKTKVPTL